MKKFNILVIVIILITALTSCKSMLSSAERAERDELLNELLLQAESGDYQIKMNTAFPLTTTALNNVLNGVLVPNGDSASRIDLNDRNDFIILGKENVKADVSYYGERRISGSYGGTQDNGIKYEGLPLDYSTELDYEKGILSVIYRISNQTESFDVTIELFTNGNANVNISSSHRSNIRYIGRIEELEELEL